MKTAPFSIRVSGVLLPVAFAFLGAACDGHGEPSDERPNSPQKIVEKRIDPPRYERKKECTATYTTGTNKGKCKTYVWKSKEVDDRDWILITSNGAYDVEENEYNSVNIGDYWPR